MRKEKSELILQLKANHFLEKQHEMVKRVIICIFLAILAIVIIIASCNMVVIHYSKDRLYDNVKDIPYKEVGLLLGTSPVARFGGTNIYFTYRIDAAAKL